MLAQGTALKVNKYFIIPPFVGVLHQQLCKRLQVTILAKAGLFLKSIQNDLFKRLFIVVEETKTMPTIEIISLNSNRLNLNQDDFEVAIIEEHKLESHKGLFYDFLVKQNGTIVHLGNPGFKNDKDIGFFAGQLINWGFNPETHFQFRDKYKSDLEKIMLTAINKSPNKTIYFLTDYQCSNEPEYMKVNNSQSFWHLHDIEGLRLNTLYEIIGK